MFKKSIIIIKINRLKEKVDRLGKKQNYAVFSRETLGIMI